MRLDRLGRTWRGLAATAGLAAALEGVAWGQVPLPPSGPVCAPTPRRVGPIRRAFHRMGDALHEKWVGDPALFEEPPLGFYMNETFGMMKAKADLHDFLVYRSDFVDGTTTLSPIGAQRLTLMANRLPKWLGPVVVEWTPDRPGLAEARRGVIVAALAGAGLPIVPERVVIGPSPDPGLIGPDAANNFNIMIARDVQAPTIYSVTPTSTASFGGGFR